MNTDLLLSAAFSQLVQLTLVIAIAAIIVKLFCRRRPHLAYALWLLALVKCLTPPVWSSATGIFSWYESILHHPQSAVVEKTDRALPIQRERTSAIAEIPAQPPALTEGFKPSISIASVVVWVWISGSMGVFAWLLVYSLILRARLMRSALQVPEELAKEVQSLARKLGIRKPVRFVITDQSIGPALIGFFQPILVIPDTLRRATTLFGLRPILAHELVHLSRRDHLVAAVQWVAQSVWWFHPLVWWMNRRMNQSRELCCDEQVVALLDCDPADYAQSLVDVLRLRRQLRTGALALGMRPFQVTEERLEHIMKRGSDQFYRRTPLYCWLAVLLGGVLLLPGAGWALQDVAPATRPADQAAPKAVGERTVLSGHVIDKDTGKPIAGATVTVRRFVDINTDRNREIGRTQHITDNSGRFEFFVTPEEIAQNVYLEVETRHPQYASRTGEGYGFALIQKEIKSGDQPFFSEIKIGAGELVTGVITDPAGKPLAGVQLRYAAFPNIPEREIGRLSRESGFSGDTIATDAQGRFTFNAPKGGRITSLFVNPKDYAAFYAELGARRGDVGVFRLDDGYRVTGRVLDEKGAPVPNARIRVNSLMPSRYFNDDAIECESTTNPQGQFTLDPLPVGRYTVKIEVSGSDAPVFMSSEIGMPWPGMNMPETVIRAVPKVRFVAQYFDSHGVPTQGHPVDIFGTLKGQHLFFTAQIDEKGRIEGSLPAGLEDVEMKASTNVFSSLRVRRGASGPLLSTQSIKFGTVNSDITDVQIVRYTAPILKVMAVDQAGKPLDSAKYRITLASGEDGNLERQADGFWRSWQLLPDEDFKVTIEQTGYQTFTQTLKLAEGETRDLKATLIAP